jgi:peroxiredoxin
MPFDSDKDGLLDQEETEIWGTDPYKADSDGDNTADGDEIEIGTNPLDANDHPYFGGWPIDAWCRGDIVPSGNLEGQVTDNFSLLDQFGEVVRLWDFCGRAVLLVSGAGYCGTCQDTAHSNQTTYEHFRDQGFIVLYLFGMDQLGNIPDQQDLVDWAEYHELDFPVLADENFAVANRYINTPTPGIPAYTLLAPGAVVDISYTYSVTANDIEDILPARYPGP